MALLTRRTVVGAVLGAGLATAGATLVAALALRKPARPAGQGTPDVPDAPPTQMRPLTDMVLARPPTALPDAVFRTLDGAPTRLAAYAGRPMVLNFWATWCVPCVAELPELDRLAATGAFTVLAVSADRGGAAVVGPFAAAHGIRHATILLDPGSQAVHALGVAGFPTTLLVAADGRLRGTLEGPAAWGDAATAIAAILAPAR
jgi:thiol-disulfide isomerase/thioredoxin